MTLATGSSGDLPTRSQVQHWSTSHLAEAAASWRQAASRSENAFDEHRQNIASPGGTTWEGDAKDAALDRVTADVAVVARQGEVLREAADLAENGAHDINAAKDKAIEAITAAVGDGFSVTENLKVTDARKYDFTTIIERNRALVEHAEAIRWTAEQLIRTAELVGKRLQSKADELVGIRFDGEDNASASGSVRSVNNTIKQTPTDDPNDPYYQDPPEPGGGYGSYHYGYQFSTREGWSKEKIMAEVQENFNRYFTFSADTGKLVEGATVNLKGPFGEDEPVRVTDVTPNSFSFVSLPGHMEGAGRVIKFSIVPAEASPVPGRTNWELRVEASGPLSKGSFIPGASWVNKGIWQVFANNLDSRLPTLRPQTGVATM